MFQLPEKSLANHLEFININYLANTEQQNTMQWPLRQQIMDEKCLDVFDQNHWTTSHEKSYSNFIISNEKGEKQIWLK